MLMAQVQSFDFRTTKLGPNPMDPGNPSSSGNISTVGGPEEAVIDLSILNQEGLSRMPFAGPLVDPRMQTKEMITPDIVGSPVPQ